VEEVIATAAVAASLHSRSLTQGRSLSKSNGIFEDLIADVWLRATGNEEITWEHRLALKQLRWALADLFEVVVRKRKGEKVPRRVLVRQEDALRWFEGYDAQYSYRMACVTLSLDEGELRSLAMRKLRALERESESDERRISPVVRIGRGNADDNPLCASMLVPDGMDAAFGEDDEGVRIVPDEGTDGARVAMVRLLRTPSRGGDRLSVKYGESARSIYDDPPQRDSAARPV